MHLLYNAPKSQQKTTRTHGAAHFTTLLTIKHNQLLHKPTVLDTYTHTHTTLTPL